MNVKEILNTPIDTERRIELAAKLDSVRGVLRSEVGRTILGRGIDMYAFGSGKRRLLYVGAHHALESITENILFAMMFDVLGIADSKTKIDINKNLLLQKFTFYIIPALNLDGIALVSGEGRENVLAQRQRRMCGGDFFSWQANARGVDLNHNYDAGFYEYKRYEEQERLAAGASLYSGEYPESEPESRAVANLVRTLDLTLVVALHTQGEEVYYYPERRGVERLAKAFARKTGYIVSHPSGTASYGGLCDYTGTLGIPSLTLELGHGNNPLPVSDAVSIYSRVGSALISLPTMM